MPVPQSTVSQPVQPPVGVPQNAAPQGRDLEREATALKKIGGMPLNADPISVYKYIYSPEELQNIPDYQKLVQTQTGATQAQQEMQAIKPTKTGMLVLEQALRMKSDPGKQKIGQSELFGMAGLNNNYVNLEQSLRENALGMARNYDSFANMFQVVGTYMKDSYNQALDSYKTLQGQYDQQVKNLQDTLKDINAHEQAIDIMNKQHALDLETLKIKNQYDIDKEERANSANYYGDYAEGQPDNLPYKNLITGSGTITAEGSPAWKPGLDVAASLGTPLTAPGNIQIIKTTSGFKSLGPNNEKGKGQNHGFGNQVKAIFTDGPYKGYEVWLSHLDSINANVKEGSTYGAGDVLGFMGNTGYTMGKTGVHTDITMRDPNGKLLTARQVADILKTPTTKSPKELGQSAANKVSQFSPTLGTLAKAGAKLLGDQGVEAGVKPNYNVEGQKDLKDRQKTILDAQNMDWSNLLAQAQKDNPGVDISTLVRGIIKKKYFIDLNYQELQDFMNSINQ